MAATVPASRTTTHGALMHPAPYPTRRPAALHLLHGWWVASCPDCGHELGRRRDQEAGEEEPKDAADDRLLAHLGQRVGGLEAEAGVRRGSWKISVAQ